VNDWRQIAITPKSSRWSWRGVIGAIAGRPTLSAFSAEGWGCTERSVRGSSPRVVRCHVNHGKLLEFCPDGTCDGFVTSGNLPIHTLSDFAYLYVFFFSNNVVLDDWRRTEDARSTTEGVLAKDQYRKCANTDPLEAARCVLRDLSRGGRIRLIFVHTMRENESLPRRSGGRTCEDTKADSLISQASARVSL
jgi:hypothetical protein